MGKNVARIDLWLEVLADPLPLFAREKHRATLPEGAKHLTLAAVLFSLFYAATFHLLPGAPAKTNPFDWFSLLFFIVVNTAATFLAVTALTAVNFGFAKLFGGKGRFAEQYYLHAIILAPTLLIYYGLKLFPGLGWVLGVALLFYYAYLNLHMLKEVHRLPTAPSFFALFLPAALLLFALVVSGITQKVRVF